MQVGKFLLLEVSEGGKGAFWSKSRGSAWKGAEVLTSAWLIWGSFSIRGSFPLGTAHPI